MTKSKPFSDSPQYIPFDSPDGVVVPLRSYFLTDRDTGEISIDAGSAPLSSTTASIGSSGTSTSINEGSGPDNSEQKIVINSLSPNQLISENQSTTVEIQATLINGDSNDLLYQWEIQLAGTTSWSEISGETNNQLTIGPVIFANDHESKYRCIITSDLVTNSPLISNEILVEVRRIISITQQPFTDKSSYATGESSIVTVSGIITSDVIAYQWQEKQFADTVFVTVSGGTGANTSTYITEPLTENDQYKEFRCILTNPEANTVISDPISVNIFGADLLVSPPVNGVSFWTFASNGNLIMDGGSSIQYDITVLNSDKNIRVKMWGQGASGNAYGGYSEGFVPITLNSDYTIKLNAGAGPTRTGSGSGTNQGYPGGGYAGMFDGTTVSQSSAIMIAGGAGGGAPSIGGSASSNGGAGGGSSGTAGQNSADTVTGSTGGGGGSQSSGGYAGSGSGTSATSGSALQGGTGGQGSGTSSNWSAGGGGGGGYFGGGGGGGGDDYGSGTRAASGGGGGSGFIDSVVISGVTQGYGNTSDPDRGNAGQPGYNSRVVFSMDIITISQQPSFDEAAYNTGETATISLTASITGGRTISYQWQIRQIGSSSWFDISGATSSSYTFTVNASTDSGNNYRCVLTNIYTPTIISNSATLFTTDNDLQIDDGTTITYWSLSLNGPLELESTTSKEYTITIINPIIDFVAKLWGQGGESCANSGKGGYATGILPVNTGDIYKFVLSSGKGTSVHYDGGGYSGIFANTVTRTNSRLISGGGGGSGRAGDNSTGGCGIAGGNGGATTGITGTNGELLSVGGGGGTQSSGGSGGISAQGNLSRPTAGSGSALQGGTGGAPSSSYQNDFGGGFWYYYGTYYGGGGGGGYFGGGGGGGGGAGGNGSATEFYWDASGGGGGSSYIHSSVVSGVTSELTGSTLLNDTDRNNAGNPGAGAKSRIVIKEREVLYTDSAGRILILSCATSMRDPATLVKTNGRVLPNTNKVIDNTRWQSIRSLTGDYRLVPTLNNSKIPLATPASNNITILKNSNVLPLVNDLTNWQTIGWWDPSIQSITIAWDEINDYGYSNTPPSIGWGLNSDYSGISWDPSSGFGYYQLSNNPPFTSNFTYGHKTANWWILPPGVSNFTKSATQSATSVSQKPSCTSAQYGIYTRSGSAQSSFPHSDNRQIIILWAGTVIYDGDASVVQVNGGITIGDHTYVSEGHVASNYGWNSNGVSCGTASPPNGDFVNAFNIARWS